AIPGQNGRMTIEVDPGVLVVGAGPTGLAAAIELARHGTSVRIIDRKAGPTALSKAVGIAAHSLELLEPSGVTERLLARGRRLTHIRFHHADREIAALDFGTLRHRFRSEERRVGKESSSRRAGGR